MRRGEEWGSPVDDADRPCTVDVAGGDAALAQAAATHPGTLLAFRPDASSDLARALGLGPTPAGAVVLPCDALRLGDGTVAVNAVVLGIRPDRLRPWHRRTPVEITVDGRPVAPEAGRATTVVVATGQYLHGADVAPRGHPGDGRAEVQAYALRPGERGPMRGRLPAGTHVPHPRIAERSGRLVTVRWTGGRAGRRGAPVEVDGCPGGRARELRLEVLPGAVRVLG